MRTLRYVIELVAFLALVWLGTAGLRLLAGEPWVYIMHRPFWFLP
jgi:hypothetical protein